MDPEQNQNSEVEQAPRVQSQPVENQSQDTNTQTPPPAPEAEKVSDSENNDHSMAMLAYILFFIPLLAVKKRSLFLNYHLNQGLSLFIVALVGSAVLSTLGSGLDFLANIWSLLVIIMVVLGIVNVSKNESRPLPVIGNWFKLIK